MGFQPQAVAFATLTVLGGLTGCAYRLAAPLVVTSPLRLRIISDTPERYNIGVQSSEHHVPSDGRVMFDIKMVHRGCSVYLFDRIPIRRVADPTKEKIVSILLGGMPVRRYSFQELSKLKADNEGYHQMPLSQTIPRQKPGAKSLPENVPRPYSRPLD
ncbi:MAG TPA: hypothetical protein VG815_03050 [Chloroflexota bacterium]|nr:hypothetical protein [Chloroflexota bacterium]